MECIFPPALTEQELSAALDGEAGSAVQQHLAQCPYCAGRLEAARRLEQRLKIILYRFDCPPSQQLVDYDAGLIDPASAQRLRQHIATCARCGDELRRLQVFLDDDGEAAPSLRVVRSQRQRPGELVAQPRADTAAWAARGLQDGQTQDWEVEGATIFLELNHRAEGLVLSGQVVDETTSWTGALAELRQSETLQGVSVLDKMGEFHFVLTEAEPASLTITAPGGTTLVLESITLND